MEGFSALSSANTVLEAVRFAADANIPALSQLVAQRFDALNFETTLQILLTYLPEGLEPSSYTDFLKQLAQESLANQNVNAYDDAIGTSHTTSFQDLPEDEARRRVKRLRLATLRDQQAYYDQNADPLTLFLLRQAHRIDVESGSLEAVAQLLEPFIDHSEVLRTWMISYLLPLLRLDYEYYPHSGPSHSLGEFEKLDGGLAVQSLLSKGAQRKDPGDTQDVGRDLKALVGPWMYGDSARKRRKLGVRSRRKSSLSTAQKEAHLAKPEEAKADWSPVNEWLLDLSLRDFQRSVDAFKEWNGPGDVDYGEWGSDIHPMGGDEELESATRSYAQTGLAAVYATGAGSLETIIGSHAMLIEVANLANVDVPPDLKRTGDPIASGISRDFLNRLSPAQLLYNALLRPGNTLTTPTQSSVNLFNIVLSSCYKLFHFGNGKTCKEVAHLLLFAHEEEQRVELRKTLYTLKGDKTNKEVWPSIRKQFLWMRNWELPHGTEDEPRGIFSRIPKFELEVELLRAMLEGEAYVAAVNIYCGHSDLPLPVSTVGSTVASALLATYDAASNCRRDIGGVRKASEMLGAFRNHFPDIESLTEINALLTATDTVSHYSLTLERGVPFQPVNIRASKDPVSLIGRILSQNEHSYTHLDPLLELGRQLVLAGLVQQTDNVSSHPSATQLDLQITAARQRITKMAIESALENDDFDTAYSYATTRLPSPPQQYAAATDSADSTLPQDDISWRAAFEAGRFPIESSTSLRAIEQRLELLSQALLLAPSPALSDVLAAWQQCEKEMNAKIAREAAEEEHWDRKGDGQIPGSFGTGPSSASKKPRDPSRHALVEEAPIGLFDVARGAANALSRSAFPLRGTQKGEATSAKAAQRPLSTTSLGSSDEGEMGAQGRVRKRDMVSNMVTGGLASGIGWVIGAPTVIQQD
ncbi:hypothetical protein MMC21_002058 [Puttea exsequens]|nr:hypothetical protein [Puttea exsequens]